MVPFQVCFAPMVSWALVFSGPQPPEVQPGFWPAALQCFSEKATCEMAAIAANQAFAWDSGHVYRKAACQEQPPK